MNANASRTSIYVVHSINVVWLLSHISVLKFSAEYRSRRGSALRENERIEKWLCFCSTVSIQKRTFPREILSHLQKGSRRIDKWAAQSWRSIMFWILGCTFARLVFQGSRKIECASKGKRTRENKIYTSSLFIYHSLPLAAELAIPPVNFCNAMLLSFFPRLHCRNSKWSAMRAWSASLEKIKPAKPLVVKKWGSRSKNQARPSVLIFPLK